MEKSPWFHEQLVLLVHGPPLVGMDGLLPLPSLKVKGGPDDVEEGKCHEANVVRVLWKR